MDSVTGGAIAMIVLMFLRIVWGFCGMRRHPEKINNSDPSNIEMQDMTGRERPTAAQQDAPYNVPAQQKPTIVVDRPDSFDWGRVMQMHHGPPAPATAAPPHSGPSQGPMVAPPPRIFDWTGTNAISDEELDNALEGSSRGVPRRSRYRNSHYYNWV